LRLFTVGLLILFSVLIYTLVWGKNGLIDNASIHSEILVQKSVNEGLQRRNNEMFAEIDDLKQGLDAIEERARNELGMVKEGETFYRIVGDQSQ